MGRCERRGVNPVRHESIGLSILYTHKCTTTGLCVFTLILIELDNEGEATIIWVGTHKEYEATFKSNKKTIEKWLRSNSYLD